MSSCGQGHPGIVYRVPRTRMGTLGVKECAEAKKPSEETEEEHPKRWEGDQKRGLPQKLERVRSTRRCVNCSLEKKKARLKEKSCT